MADCEKYNTMISAGLDGQLSIEEKAELGEHLKSCAECRSYSELMERMKSALGDFSAEPPAKLAEGIMYKAELASSRRRFGRIAWGRYTAIAAILCVAMLGAARLAPILKGGAKEASYTHTAAGAAPNRADISESADEPQENLNSFAYSLSPEKSALDDEDAFMTDGADLTRLDLYMDAKDRYDESFYEIAVIYGTAPQSLWDCPILYSDPGRTDYRVPLEAMLDLELEGSFAEIYFDDLMADYGLVIAVTE